MFGDILFYAHQQELFDEINKTGEQCNLLLRDDNQSNEYDAHSDRMG